MIVARAHDGAIACRANRWRRDPGTGLKRLTGLFGGTPFGDPSQDAARASRRSASGSQRGIAESQQPPVDGVIVFTNPAAKLRIDGCSYPVTDPQGPARATCAAARVRANGRSTSASAERVVQALTE